MNAIRRIASTSLLAATVAGGLVAGAATAGATAGVPDSSVVWRAALEVQVGNVDYAGTDGDIYAQINGSRTYLNKANDDFVNGSKATYKLRLDGIGGMKDINSITIGNASTDGVCIERFVLHVNDRVMVESGRLETVGGTADCKWIDRDDGGPQSYTFTKAQNPTAWRTVATNTPPTFMYTSTIEDTLEDEMGNAFYPYTSWIGWGDIYGAPVEVSRAGTNLGVNNAMNIDFDLENEIGLGSEYDLDLVALFSCNGQIVNVNVAPAPGENDQFGLSGPLARQLKLSLENRLKATGSTCSKIEVADKTVTMIK